MDIFNYDKDAKKAIKYLDKLDLSDAFNLCFKNKIREISDIKSFLETNGFPGIHEKCFTYLTNEELIEYLREKYNIYFVEVTEHYMHRFEDTVYKFK